MGSSKNWTNDEVLYLQENWGIRSIPAIAKQLGRSVEAIKLKAQREGLGRHLHSSEDITLPQLLEALGLQNNYTTAKKRWMKLGLPVKRRKVVKNSFLVINIDDFWKWAEKHKDEIDFSRFEENNLGKEPAWVKEKRKADYDGKYRFKHTPWTKEEDNRLIYMLQQYRYNMFKISEALRRTEGAIKRRICTLGLKERPIKENARWWTDEEVEILINLREKGYSFEHIGEQLKRTGSACRGRYERLQNPDYFKRANRRAREHFKQFWQKDMCIHWDKRNGCRANETSCDECTSFIRKDINESSKLPIAVGR